MKSQTVLLAVLLMAASVTLAACSQPERDTRQTEPDHSYPGESLAAISKTAENLRQLAVDMAQSRGCKYLNGRIMVISSQGAQAAGDIRPDTGNLYIRDCKIKQIDPQRISVELQATGWRWIERDIESYGATFAFDENVRFDVTITTTGTFDMIYAPDEHIATIYFVPTQPVEAAFEVTGDVKVRTESLWSSIVGEAAPIFGQPLQERALERISEKGVHSIKTRLDHGFTLIVDLCTGHFYTKFGHFEPGKLPEPATPTNGKYYEVNSRAVLHQKSLLMTGPFKANGRFYAKFQNNGNHDFKALWMCKPEAEQIITDYGPGQRIDVTNALTAKTIPAGQTVEFDQPADLACPAVLLMLPANGERVPVSFDYAVIYPDRVPEPIIQCD